MADLGPTPSTCEVEADDSDFGVEGGQSLETTEALVLVQVDTVDTTAALLCALEKYQIRSPITVKSKAKLQSLLSADCFSSTFLIGLGMSNL